MTAIPAPVRLTTTAQMDIDAIGLRLNSNAGPFLERFHRFNRRFADWTGSSRPEHHHHGMGGLARHTLEVIRIGLAVRDTLPSIQDDVDPWKYFVAALYHDTGKLDDYEWRDGSGWQAAPHKHLVHHVTSSVLRLVDQQKLWKISDPPGFDEVVHAILAHHGRREWGSPVAPATRLAWLLHLSDALSARLDDCVKFDPFRGVPGKHHEPNEAITMVLDRTDEPAAAVVDRTDDPV